jgi:uncharacterized protein with ParB-like and HNH nuclease domain
MITIKQLIEGINDEYFLPIIQREYEWLNSPAKKKIENYLDSIYKGYPLGLFIFYKVNKNSYSCENLLKFTKDYRSGQICTNPIIEKNEIKRENITLVYDGQQRMTSLYIAFKRGYKKGKKHFKMYFRPDKIRRQEKLETPRFLFIDSDDDVVYKDFEGEKSAFVKLEKIYELDSMKINEFVSDKELPYNSVEAIGKLSKLLLENLSLEPCEYMESEFTNGQMLTIFVRLNSGEPIKREGINLSFFYDTFAEINFREKINELNESLKNTYCISGFSPEKLLTSILLIINENPKIHIDEINDSIIDKVKDNFVSIGKKLISAAEYIYEDLSYKNMKKLKLSLRYPTDILGFYMFSKDIDTIKSSDKLAITEFIRLYQFKQWNKGSKVTERLNRIRKYIRESENFVEVLRCLKNHDGDRLEINDSDIESCMQLKYGDNLNHYVLQMLFPHLAYDNVSFDVDHIFPKSKNYDDNKVNNIANLQFLSTHENSPTQKGDQPPIIWYNGKSETEKQNLVRDGLLTSENLDNFDKFIETRKKLLEKKLKGIAYS